MSFSGRGKEMPRDWQRRRAQVRARAQGRCERVDDDGIRCRRDGTECHHAVARDDHRIESLAWLCAPCHAEITHKEAAEGYRKMLEKLQNPRARRRAPGLL